MDKPIRTADQIVDGRRQLREAMKDFPELRLTYHQAQGTSELTYHAVYHQKLKKLIWFTEDVREPGVLDDYRSEEPIVPDDYDPMPLSVSEADGYAQIYMKNPDKFADRLREIQGMTV